MWDSLGAGMVAAKCMAREENLRSDDDAGGLQPGGLLRRNPHVKRCEDVPEEKRVKDIFVRVEMGRGCVHLVYEMTTGETVGEREVVWESRGDDGGLR